MRQTLASMYFSLLVSTPHSIVWCGSVLGYTPQVTHLSKINDSLECVVLIILQLCIKSVFNTQANLHAQI